MNEDVRAYHAKLDQPDGRICEALHATICKILPTAVNKVWHGHPVWFINDNPIVGYHKLKDGVRLLFWSGQSFDEPGLIPEGTFKAAGVRYTTVDQVDKTALEKWLRKSEKIQWDYKNIVKRRGKLELLET